MMIRVEVVAGHASRQELVELRLDDGATAIDAVRQSRVLEYFPELAGELMLGIWGKRVEEDAVLRDGDRVELYRPLRLEPKEARRQLALIGKTMRGEKPG